jgi:hypothetical protein
MTRKEHLLVILMEECAEIQKECAKALRFGLDEFYAPDGPETNAESINREISDLVGVMQMLQDDGHLQLIDYKRVEEKVKKVEKYLEYSKKVGTLD